MSQPKAIVIGAGFGGIAAALRLRAKGYRVTLIDKQDKLGGRAYQYERKTELGTFIHDAGPTVITAKFLFDELFELFGKKREDYMGFVDIYPWYRIQFDDGTHFNYGGTVEQMEAEIAKIEPRDVEGFRQYLIHSKKIFDVGFTKLGCVPFHDFSTMLKCAPALMKLGNYRTVYSMAKKYIRSEKLRRVFSFQPLLVGGNPFNTTSIYSLIFYLERQWGVQFCMGGTGAIVRGFEKLMHEEGVEIRLGEEVERIQIKSKPTEGQHRELYNNANSGRKSPARRLARGPHVDGVTLRARGVVNADIIVANGDAPQVWHHLIDPLFRTWKSKVWLPRLKYSMGLFVLYFGTRKSYPNLAHHTIVLGKTYKELLTKIFDRFELETEDLSVYLHRPTATDPSMAPAGCESFYVLVPVPNLKGGQDWSKVGPQMRDATVRYLERTVLPGLSECIVDDFYVTPEHFSKNLNTMYGSGFSIQPLFSQSAYFRFHNKAPGIEGLYFVGAGTHPGAGMPGVLCSAKVVDSMVPFASGRG